MAVAWQSFYDELVSSIRVAWPEVRTSGGGGIHDANEMERMTQERIAAFPYAVVDLAAAPSADWGMNNSMFEVRCEVHYIAELDLGMQVLRDKLDALRHQFLRSSAFTTATCLDCTEMTVGVDSPAMATFIQKGLAFVGGRCTFVFVIGETITDTAP